MSALKVTGYHWIYEFWKESATNNVMTFNGK